MVGWCGPVCGRMDAVVLSDVRLVLLVQLFVVVLFVVRCSFDSSCSVVGCGTVCEQMFVWYFFVQLFALVLFFQLFWSIVLGGTVYVRFEVVV